MLEKTELFSFTGLRRPLALINSESLYRHLFTILRDWEIKRLDQRTEQPPAITIQKTGVGFQRRSRWLSKPAIFRNPADVVCDFIVDLFTPMLPIMRDCSVCIVPRLRLPLPQASGQAFSDFVYEDLL